MSETALTLNDRAEAICACLGSWGITRIIVDQYQSNSEIVHSVTASGDCGDGPVSVTAIQEGVNSTYMMRGPATADGEPEHIQSASIMRGVYRDIGHELLWFLADYPGGVGVIDLPLATVASMPHAA